MACKAGKLYLALYRTCLQPLNGRWTVGNTRHGKDLGVGWRERRGWTRRCTDYVGGESRVWALCGKQEERKWNAGAISALCSQDDSADSLSALCVLGHSLRSRRELGYQNWAPISDLNLGPGQLHFED